jgi:hypothetical protein
VQTILVKKQLYTIEYKHLINKGLIKSKIALEKYYKKFIRLFNKKLIKLALLKH